LFNQNSLNSDNGGATNNNTNPQNQPTTTSENIVSHNNPTQSQTPQTESVQQETIQPSIDELRDYALQLINEDRAWKGLSLVKLSNNQAAQTHAEDMLKASTLSHYMTDGEKPYMVYTRFAELGDVGQKAAAGVLYTDVQGCINQTYICDPIDVKEEIKRSEYGMMYNDSSHNWGHRDNILDKHHTDVSIGIAFDRYSYYMTQNFEGNYIDYTSPMSEKIGIVTFAGNLKSGSLSSIEIYYDPPPTTYTYQQHKDDDFYKMGDQIATVQPPPESGKYYLPSNSTVEVADLWVQQGNYVNIAFDISPFVTQPGVYTIVAFLDDNGEPFPVTAYSITKPGPMVQEGFKSSKVYYACTQNQLDQFDQLQQQSDILKGRLDPLNQQYDRLLTEYNSRPQTASSEQEYQEGLQMYNQLESMRNQINGLVGQINNLQNQLENFRC